MIEYLPRSQPIHRPHPFGDATEHDGEGLAVLLSILGNVHRVQDARVVEGSLSKLSERRGHLVGSGPTTGDSPSARTAEPTASDRAVSYPSSSDGSPSPAMSSIVQQRRPLALPGLERPGYRRRSTRRI